MDVDDLLFNDDHVWVRLEGKKARIGVSDFAQEDLGEVTAVDLPGKGDEIEKDAPFGELEAFQNALDLIAPVTGTVVEVNPQLDDDPSVINRDPYREGWVLLVSLSDTNELKSLMDYSEYQEHLASEET